MEQSIEDNIISSKWKTEIENVIKSFISLAAANITEASREENSTIKALGLALSEEQQKTFSETYYITEDEPQKLWEKLKEQPGFNDEQVIKKTKLLFNVGIVSGNQPELTERLYKRLVEDPEIKDVSGFAKFTKDTWKEHILSARVVSFPQWVKGDTPEEKTENYAALLENFHKQMYPTTVFASRLKDDPSSSFPSKNDLAVFFEKNPEFDLQTSNVKKQLESSNFDSIQDIDAVKEDVIKMNRLYKLTDEYKHVNALHSKKLASARDIVSKYGEQEFKKEFAAALGGEENGSRIYKRAVSANNITMALLTSYLFRHDVKLFAIDGNNKAPEGYHKTFNDGELCECEHCQSVYSPAAYFVDMLAFIKKAVRQRLQNCYDAGQTLMIFYLRAKIQTHPYPYIDLVNELLEKKVLKLSNPGMTPDPEDQSYQTEGSAVEIAAIPEHVAADAYNELETVNTKSAFSSILPFHLPLEQLRVYTDKLGWKRYEVMDQIIWRS